MKQNDLGTSLVLLSILVGFILVSGITWKIIVPIFSSGAAIAVSIILSSRLTKPEILEKYLHVQEYKFNRIYAWLDPF